MYGATNCATTFTTVSGKLDFVQFCDGISERIAGPFFLFLLINSAFGYEFRKKRKKLQSASSGSARQKLYKVEEDLKKAIR